MWNAQVKDQVNEISQVKCQVMTSALFIQMRDITIMQPLTTS